jgi:hypothetical protein
MTRADTAETQECIPLPIFGLLTGRLFQANAGAGDTHNQSNVQRAHTGCASNEVKVKSICLLQILYHTKVVLV